MLFLAMIVNNEIVVRMILSFYRLDHCLDLEIAWVDKNKYLVV